MFDDLLKHRSGRVIALARVVLVAVFLFAIWVDPTQPVQAIAESYILLSAYLAASIAVAFLTWNQWWLDARLAAPMHVADVGLFALLVLASDGYTSPFFVFFVFLVLSAAIRWSWRQTALTAAAVTIIYFAMGLATSSPADPDFDLQRFIIRSANLVILSGLLIWFGVTHGFSIASIGDDRLFDPAPDEDPLGTTVETAARLAAASSALLLWRQTGSFKARAVMLADGASVAAGADGWDGTTPECPFLFDTRRNRALRRGFGHRMRFSTADSLLDRGVAERFSIHEGLALAVRTDSGEGMLLLGGIHSLCADHIDFGESLGPALARHVQRHALLSATEEGAVARARLSLARDLHDSIVQFLAGATFRVEAISRALRSGEQPLGEMNDLKRLLLQEQQELRSAIGALRMDRIGLPELASDLKALCERLSRQWDISCSFSAEVPEGSAPMRLHLDTHQLVREAVANAVRHAAAKSVTVALTAEDRNLRLDISNDGHAHDRLEKGDPWSLRERVDEADGTLMLASRESGTSVSITLPLKGQLQP